jgi:hypothetical protein
MREDTNGLRSLKPFLVADRKLHGVSFTRDPSAVEVPVVRQELIVVADTLCGWHRAGFIKDEATEALRR